MKYVIYEMVCPDFLKSKEIDGYSLRNVERNVLEELYIYGVDSRHDSFELAFAEIKLKADKLKHLNLTIMPLISVSWDGEIK